MAESNVETERPSKKFIGVCFAFASALFFTFNGVIVQVTQAPSIQVVWWRCAGQILFLVPVTCYRHAKGYPDADLFGHLTIYKPRGFTIPKLFVWLVVRGTVGSCALWLINEAYTRLPVGDAYALLQSGVLWASIISWVWIGDKPHWSDIFCIPLTLLGVVCFARPPFLFGGEPSDLVGILVVLVGAFLGAFTHNIVRMLGKKVHFTVSILYFSLMGFLISSIVIVVTSRSLISGFFIPCGYKFLLLVYSGPNGLMGLSCLTLALQREATGRVTIVRSSEIPLAYLIQVYLFDKLPTLLSIVGCLTISFSALTITIRKCLTSRSNQE